MSEALTMAGAVNKTNRLLRLSLREITDLLIAQCYLVGALWTVRRRPKGELLKRVGRVRYDGRRRDERRLADLAVAVDRAARKGLFRPSCLVRAVALERLMWRAGAGRAVVKVGVLKGGSELLAHAWIEIDGHVVGDEPSHVRRFTPLENFSALSD